MVNVNATQLCYKYICIGRPSRDGDDSFPGSVLFFPATRETLSVRTSMHSREFVEIVGKLWILFHLKPDYHLLHFITRYSNLISGSKN